MHCKRFSHSTKRSPFILFSCENLGSLASQKVKICELQAAKITSIYELSDTVSCLLWKVFIKYQTDRQIASKPSKLLINSTFQHSSTIRNQLVEGLQGTTGMNRERTLYVLSPQVYPKSDYKQISQETIPAIST